VSTKKLMAQELESLTQLHNQLKAQHRDLVLLNEGHRVAAQKAEEIIRDQEQRINRVCEILKAGRINAVEALDSRGSAEAALRLHAATERALARLTER